MTPIQTWNKAIEEALDLARRVRAMTRAENVHARGIAKHGQNGTPTSRDDVDMLHADLYGAWPASRLDRLIRALKPAASDVPGDDIAADTYPMPAHGWTCFHCGDTFKTPGSARDHFGFDPSSDPACRIKVGAERGLVMALRKAEFAAAEAWAAIGEESTEAARAYYAQSTRHREQIVAAEEAGYEKGLADGRGEAPISDELVKALERLEGLLEKATPGPWEVRPCGTALDICLPSRPEDRGVGVVATVFGGQDTAALIVEAINSLPMLIDALKSQGVEKGAGHG